MEETMKSHVAGVPAKLRARDRSHAIAIALKRCIIDAQSNRVQT
jgi:DNA-binding CsgD family transcriptional regulator